MTEIRIDVDLPHPPERVWRAITDPAILREWFMEAAITKGPVTTFTLTSQDDEGIPDHIDGEVLTVRRGHQLVTQWSAVDLHTKVTLTINAGDREDGAEPRCGLVFTQVGFIGHQGALRRRALQRTYTRMFDVELRAALTRMEAADTEREKYPRNRVMAGREGHRRNQGRSFGSPRRTSLSWAGFLRAAGRNMSLLPSGNTRRAPQSVRRGLGGSVRGVAAPAGEALSESATAAMIRGTWTSWEEPEEEDTSYYRIALLASFAIMVLVATLTVLVDRMIEPADSNAMLSVGQQETAILSTPDEMMGSQFSDGEDTPALSATYQTQRMVEGGYEAAILVNNLSVDAVNGWVVSIVLPPLGLLVHDASGAMAQQDGGQVLFIPIPETRVVPAGESVRFTFEVQGAGDPVACVIEQHACAGIPE